MSLPVCAPQHSKLERILHRDVPLQRTLAHANDQQGIRAGEPELPARNGSIC